MAENHIIGDDRNWISRPLLLKELFDDPRFKELSHKEWLERINTPEPMPAFLESCKIISVRGSDNT
jgi:hypothetical protein